MELNRRNKMFYLLTVFLFLLGYFTPTFAQIPFNRFYLGAEGGYSVSNGVNFRPQQSEDCVEVEGLIGCWLNTHQSFRATIDNSPEFGGKIGYHLNSLLDLDVAYNQRNNFRWSKDFPGDFSGAPNTSPASRNRTINTIKNRTLMADVTLVPTLFCSCLQPFVSGGIGIAWNTLGDLLSTNLVNGSTAIITGDTNHSFAWQLAGGLNIPLNKHWFFDLGYRYLDMGTFRSGTRDIFLNSSSQTINQPIAYLEGKHVSTNEFFAGVNYNF